MKHQEMQRKRAVHNKIEKKTIDWRSIAVDSVALSVLFFREAQQHMGASGKNGRQHACL